MWFCVFRDRQRKTKRPTTTTTMTTETVTTTRKNKKTKTIVGASQEGKENAKPKSTRRLRAVPVMKEDGGGAGGEEEPPREQKGDNREGVGVSEIESLEIDNSGRGGRTRRDRACKRKLEDQVVPKMETAKRTRRRVALS